MKKNGKRIGILLTCALFLAGCGSTGKTMDSAAGAVENTAEYAVYDDDIYVAEETAEMDRSVDSGELQEETAEASNRKLIRTASLEVETESYDSLMSAIQQKVSALGGYMESVSSYGDGREVMRQAYLTIRIPQNRLDEFLETVGSETNVTSRSEYTEDVTLQYVDLDSRKKTLLTEQQRLLEILEEAETLEDIITLENRLSEVRYQIESMESQLRTYDNQIDYSTVDLSVSEVETYTPPADLSAGEQIRIGFWESVESVLGGLEDFGISFVIHLPYIILWVVIIALLVLVTRLLLKLSAKRAEKNVGKRKSRMQGSHKLSINPYGLTMPQQMQQNQQPGEQMETPEAGGTKDTDGK